MRSRPLVGGLSSVLLSLIISLDSPWRARATVPPSPPPPPLTPANIEIQCETGHCVPDGTPTQTLVVPLSVQVELIFSGSESYFLAADSFKLVSGVDCDTGVAASGTLDARRRATVLITTTDPLTLCTTSFDGRAYRHPEVTVTASTSIHPPPPSPSNPSTDAAMCADWPFTGNAAGKHFNVISTAPGGCVQFPSSICHLFDYVPIAPRDGEPGWWSVCCDEIDSQYGPGVASVAYCSLSRPPASPPNPPPVSSDLSIVSPSAPPPPGHPLACTVSNHTVDLSGVHATAENQYYRERAWKLCFSAGADEVIDASAISLALVVPTPAIGSSTATTGGVVGNEWCETHEMGGLPKTIAEPVSNHVDSNTNDFTFQPPAGATIASIEYCVTAEMAEGGGKALGLTMTMVDETNGGTSSHRFQYYRKWLRNWKAVDVCFTDADLNTLFQLTKPPNPGIDGVITGGTYKYVVLSGNSSLMTGTWPTPDGNAFTRTLTLETLWNALPNPLGGGGDGIQPAYLNAFTVKPCWTLPDDYVADDPSPSQSSPPLAPSLAPPSPSPAPPLGALTLLPASKLGNGAWLDFICFSDEAQEDLPSGTLEGAVSGHYRPHSLGDAPSLNAFIESLPNIQDSVTGIITLPGFLQTTAHTASIRATSELCQTTCACPPIAPPDLDSCIHPLADPDSCARQLVTTLATSDATPTAASDAAAADCPSIRAPIASHATLTTRLLLERDAAGDRPADRQRRRDPKHTGGLLVRSARRRQRPPD